MLSHLLLLLLTLITSHTHAQLIPIIGNLVPIIKATNVSAKIANQYIVKFQYNLNISAQEQVISLITNPISVSGSIGGLNIPTIGVNNVLTPGTILFNYTSDAFIGFAAIIPSSVLTLVLQLSSSIEYIEEDAQITLNGNQTTAQTTDTSQWNLDRVDQRESKENGLFLYVGNGTGINVYVIDTGVRISHQEFGGRAISAYNAINDDKGTTDCQGHGTHVAGTVGGRSYGIAKNVNIYAVRVLGCDGAGSTSTVIAGVDWVTKNRKMPAIGTMSLGGGLSSSLDTSVKNSIATGIVYTVAAGNNNGTACEVSPANVATAITVGALDRNDVRAGYSNWGSCVTLFAPGSGIRSASYSDDTSTRVLSGTSMATPLVAGVVAIYLDEKLRKNQNAVYTVQGVKDDIICSSTKSTVVDPLGSPSRVIYSFFTQPPATSTPPSSVSESCDNNSCETWTGTMNTQTIQFQPNGTSYKSTGNGYHRAWLESTGGGLLNPIQNNLILYQLKDQQWILVASSSTKGGKQQVVYQDNNGGGDFAWGIQAKGATPTSYTLTMKRPTADASIPPSNPGTTCTNNGNNNPDYSTNPGGTPKNIASHTTSIHVITITFVMISVMAALL